MLCSPMHTQPLLGSELLEQYKKILKLEEEIDDYKRELHAIVKARRAPEIEALRYVPWPEQALKQDKDDIEFYNFRPD